MDELVASGGGSDFAASLSRLGVTTVALSRGPEDDRYAWLADQPGLTLLADTGDLTTYAVDVPVPGLERLTSRERDVLACLGRGRSNAEIAADLFVTEATVKSHLVHIFTKLGVDSRSRAIHVAQETGLI